ncbi:NlpC/P60 family protein [Nitrosomonas eutropha]|uniref:NLP/P60 protein n=2 Tax=Nitrosomonas eutropha TaxID=916 RepID=Q0AHP9_NITEC|nr:NlpC/P60 family protein [Nitrosomonas eutropha]ABI59133.1 NLP/P60 protein [Nitrosomonas eutropha C91]PXV83898.1 lipoprotein Spr/probable lipoprotein NlpC [Nitrosomonas eutropha]SCX06551.1 lipoprotein Spr/probable lipoprotein NlpC [Nitrosomonas eutropha]SEI44310.1 lipoprotein Spr/probable lipoprotein NlpC [Nitrosomonas eutropha]
MSLKHIVILLLGAGMIAGCSSVPKDSTRDEISRYSHKSGFAIPQGILENDPSFVRKRLYSQYQEWRGTRYRLGGTDHTGVDCSALVRIIFKEEFGFTLPRTALSQAEFGEKISRNELMPGDLVFFKTGGRSWHVGIYLDSKKFLHASSSQGVTISSLDNTYWKSRYWKSIRI